MKKRTALWKFLVPLILGILVMSIAFIGISYVTFRDVEIRDYESYARGLTGLIAKDIIRANDVDGILQMGRAFPGYGKIEQKLEQPAVADDRPGHQREVHDPHRHGHYHHALRERL